MSHCWVHTTGDTQELQSKKLNGLTSIRGTDV